MLSSARSIVTSLRIRTASTASRNCLCIRRYSVKSAPETSQPNQAKRPKPDEAPLSSCPENTVLTGLNYLKGQPPVLAKPDEEYPAWLWDLLKPKVYTDMSPGSKGEKVMLRNLNRQRIKEQNFLKTQ